MGYQMQEKEQYRAPMPESEWNINVDYSESK